MKNAKALDPVSLDARLSAVEGRLADVTDQLKFAVHAITLQKDAVKRAEIRLDNCEPEEIAKYVEKTDKRRAEVGRRLASLITRLRVLTELAYFVQVKAPSAAGATLVDALSLMDEPDDLWEGLDSAPLQEAFERLRTRALERRAAGVAADG